MLGPVRVLCSDVLSGDSLLASASRHIRLLTVTGWTEPVPDDPANYCKKQTENRMYDLAKAEDRDSAVAWVNHNAIVSLGDIVFEHRMHLSRKELLSATDER